MNMPKVDNYGTQQPIALLKLLVENNGMYDRGKNLNWKTFKDICELQLTCLKCEMIALVLKVQSIFY